jgi:hypothetical protein
VPPEAQVVLLDECPEGPRLVPSEPLGRWAVRPISRLLKAIEPGTRITLDLERAPVSEPHHVAAVLWLERQAHACGLSLAIAADDMVSNELLAFGGVEAAAG